MTNFRFNSVNDVHNFINRSAIGADRLLTDFFGTYNDAKYPPYNIEALTEDTYRITLAVAGFSREELRVHVDSNTLSVVGTKAKPETTDDSEKSEFIYRGIAERDFERLFKLTEYVEVDTVELKDGLLVIGLHREIPEALKPKEFDIK